MDKNLLPFAAPIVAFCAMTCAAQTPSAVEVSRGYVSSSGYTNAYFGFKIPLFPGLRSKGPSSGSLLILYSGLGVEGNSLESLLIALVSNRKPSGKKEVFAGKTFYVKRETKNGSAGTDYNGSYETELGPYTLQIMINSFSKDGFKQLTNCVEGITFFDPLEARQQAGPDAAVVALQPSSENKTKE